MKAVLFDLDNTLTDRTKSIAKYSEIFLEDFRCQLVEPVTSAWLVDKILTVDQGGYGGHEHRCHLLSELPIWKKTPTPESLLAHWFSHFPHCPVAMEGLYDMLEALKRKGLKLGVITNGKDHVQRAKISALNIESYFDCIVTSGEVGIKKPAAEIFHLAVGKLGLNAEEVVYLGDHPINDYYGAYHAGLKAIWLEGYLPWPSGVVQSSSTIKGLSEIVPLVFKK
ncbi:HAD family hydrolase [Veronia nyctiphanis]|uniref:HAD family hydrolase n=1 Tax=Veronia nyctiphanis TaxID=1278244 RepID=UPI0013759F41|nr:HAD family hydrolase [Veronia nyctiphanis]